MESFTNDLTENIWNSGKYSCVVDSPCTLHNTSSINILLFPQLNKRPLFIPAANIRPLLSSRKQTLPTSASAANRSIGSTTDCTITEKAPTRAFSWLKAPTSAFTFKTLLRHYAKRALTPQSLNMKLGPQFRNAIIMRAAIRHYAN